MKKIDWYDVVFIKGVIIVSGGLYTESPAFGFIFFGLCLMYVGIARGSE